MGYVFAYRFSSNEYKALTWRISWGSFHDGGAAVVDVADVEEEEVGGTAETRASLNLMEVAASLAEMEGEWIVDCEEGGWILERRCCIRC